MIIKNAELEIVIGPTSDLPETDLPEIAFAGRSNVGKSSLINVLVSRKSLARTSAQPGKTQTINFYNVNKELYIVDLPGYGYAKTSKENQEKWAVMIDRYLTRSKQLKTVFILVDIRHEAKASDRQMYEWVVSRGLKPVIIATKADKISRGSIQKNLKILKEGLDLKKDTVIIPFSAVTKSGRDEIWAQISVAAGMEGENVKEEGSLEQ